MSALITRGSCTGIMAVIVLMAALLAPCMTTIRLSEWEEQMGSSDPIITSFYDQGSPGRGDLVLITDEYLKLESNASYRQVLLGTESTLVLENCSMTLSGDGTVVPSMRGSPSSVILMNSTLLLEGWDGSSKLSNKGAETLVDIDVSGEFFMYNSTIEMNGGDAWFKGSPGAPFDVPLGGDQFSGGNCTVNITGTENAEFTMNRSKFDLRGGNASDAPDGVSMYSDDFFPSGGYTTGADVSGWVGTGGGTSISLDFLSGEMEFSDSGINSIGGTGGSAGDGGNVFWNGSQTYTYPTSSGGYTSGGWQDGEPYDPGNVSGHVGCGGNCSLEIKGVHITIINSTFEGTGGEAGEPGSGGSCISQELGSPPTVTNTKGGGGGAGFAGGYGGYRYISQYDGGDGGDLADSVGCGGDFKVSINSSSVLLFHDIDLDIQAGGRECDISVGDGGGYLDNSLDGGGGGGSGWSGGGGAPALMLYNGLSGGASGDVSDIRNTGGSVYCEIVSEYFMSSTPTDIVSDAGVVWMNTRVTGHHGEVGGSDVWDGGSGGAGSGKGVRVGISKVNSILPAPVPLNPLDGEPVTDLSVPFRWGNLDTGLLSGTDLPVTFRLLKSGDVEDVAQEFQCTGSSTYLQESVEDGEYYWTVRIRDGSRNSTWMYPQRFFLDRSSPTVVSHPGDHWYPAEDPSPIVRFIDEGSGIDPATARCRAGPSGGPYSEWYDIDAVEEEGGVFALEAELPHREMNVTFWVRVCDRAGNGPVLAGPYQVGIDGTAPLIEHVSDGEWRPSSFGHSFRAVDNLSGLNGTYWMEISGDGSENISMDVELSQGVFRSVDEIDLSEGSYSLVVGGWDLVGNVGRSDPLSIQVDDTSPFMDSFSPADGAILDYNDVNPYIDLKDDGSGLHSVTCRFRGEDFSLDHSPETLHGEVLVDLGPSLQDGTYNWTVICTDNVGNEVTLGPYHFTVDVSGPDVSVQGAGNGSASLKYEDRVTPPSMMEVRCSVPGGSTMVEIWTREVEDLPDDLSFILGTPLGDLPYPVCYITARATDAAGNVGQWSPPLRIQDDSLGKALSVDHPEVMASGSPVSMDISFPAGIDTDSIMLELTLDGEVLTDARVTAEVTLNDTPFEDSYLRVPVEVMVTISLGDIQGVLGVSVTFRDPLPQPYLWTAVVSDVIIDGTSPVISAEVQEFYTTDRISIPIDINEDRPGEMEVEVSVADGDFLKVNEPGAPGLQRSDDGWVLRINSTYGPPVDVVVRVTDSAGNAASREFKLRSTRAPTASILMEGNGTFTVGRFVELHAECFDPDSDALDLKWMVDGNVSGDEESIGLYLGPGDHSVVLNCTDGALFAEDSVVITMVYEQISEDGGGSSSSRGILYAIGAIMVIIASIAAAVFLLLFRRGGSAADDDVLDWDDEYEDDDENVIIGKTASRDQEDASGCGICFRRIRSSSRTVKCRCGEEFHRACASREGECPECGRELMIRKDL